MSWAALTCVLSLSLPRMCTLARSLARMLVPTHARRTSRDFLTVDQVLAVLNDIIEKKVQKDALDEAAGKPVLAFIDFFEIYFLQRYGLPSMAKQNMARVLRSMLKHQVSCVCACACACGRFQRFEGVAARHSTQHATNTKYSQFSRISARMRGCLAGAARWVWMSQDKHFRLNVYCQMVLIVQPRTFSPRLGKLIVNFIRRLFPVAEAIAESLTTKTAVDLDHDGEADLVGTAVPLKYIPLLPSSLLASFLRLPSSSFHPPLFPSSRPCLCTTVISSSTSSLGT